MADFVNRARSLIAAGKHLEAVKACRLGLLAHPSQLDGRLALGTALLVLGRFDEVLAEMRVALELDGLNADAHRLKGEALVGRGDHRQARDTLEQAARLAPADARVPDLLARVHAAIESASSIRSRATNEPSWTRGYPGHEGAAVAVVSPAGADSSEGVTLPGDEAPTTIEPAMPMAIADTMVAFADEVELADFAAAALAAEDLPAAGSYSDGSSTVTFADDGRTEVSEALTLPIDDVIAGFSGDYSEDVELRYGDLVPAMPELAPAEPSASAASTIGFDDARDAVAAAPLFLDRDSSGLGRRTSPRVQTDLPRPRAGAPLPAPGDPRVEELFPEDEDGVSKIHMFEDVAGLSPSRARDSVPGPPPPLQQPAARAPTPGTQARHRHSEDMRTIRAGLGIVRDPRAAGAHHDPGPPPSSSAASAPPGVNRGAPATALVRTSSRMVAVRRRIPMPVLLLLTILFLGGGVAGGVALRSWRTSVQVDAAETRARELLAAGNYLDHLRAGALLDRILDVSQHRDVRALRARVAAATEAQFGGSAGADKMVDSLGDDGGLDALAARAQLALAAGETERALELAGTAAESYEHAPVGYFLRGLAQVELGQLSGATASLEAALSKGGGPLVAARLAETYRLAGQAEKGATIAETGSQPALAIARARSLAAAASLPDDSGIEVELEAIVSDGALAPARQQIGVSARQVGAARLALAEVALARGDRQGARSQLSRLDADEAASDAPFVAAYAEALLDSGESGAAEAPIARLAKAWPSRPRTHLLAARLALARGDRKATRRELVKIERPDEWPQALAIRGELALDVGRLDEAEDALDRALAASPRLADAMLARARLDLAKGEPEKAIERLARLPSGVGEKRDIVEARARVASGKVEEARSLLAGLTSLEAQLELGRLERDVGRFKQAISVYGKVLVASPDDPIARLERALIQFEEGAGEGATATLEKLATERSNDARVLLATARVRTLGGDPDGGINMAEAASKVIGAPSAMVDRELGRALLRQRQTAGALAALDQAKTAAPGDEEIWILIMEAYLATGDDQAGRDAMIEAGGPLDDASHGLALIRGIQHLQAREPAKAINAFRTAQGLERGTRTRRERARVAYWLGRSHYLNGDLALARRTLGRAIELDKRHADAHFSLGEVAQEEGKAAEAVGLFRRAIALDKTANPRAYFYLGELYSARRNNKAARTYLRQYLESDPGGVNAREANRLLKKIP